VSGFIIYLEDSMYLKYFLSKSLNSLIILILVPNNGPFLTVQEDIPTTCQLTALSPVSGHAWYL